MNSLLNFHQGSAHDLAFLPDGSVHAVITSPPYFGLRAYAGEQDIDWPEVVYAPMAGLPAITVPAQRCALGAETDPFVYIGHLLHCLREWRRVLRDDGVCMVNLGSSYVSGKIEITNYVLRDDLSADEYGYVMKELALYGTQADLLP